MHSSRGQVLPVKTLVKSSDIMYSTENSGAIEDVITTLLTDGTLAADFDMPDVEPITGSMMSRL